MVKVNLRKWLVHIRTEYDSKKGKGKRRHHNLDYESSIEIESYDRDEAKNEAARLNHIAAISYGVPYFRDEADTDRRGLPIGDRGATVIISADPIEDIHMWTVVKTRNNRVFVYQKGRRGLIHNYRWSHDPSVGITVDRVIDDLTADGVQRTLTGWFYMRTKNVPEGLKERYVKMKLRGQTWYPAR